MATAKTNNLKDDSKRRTVYLAGPDVFLPDPMARADALKQLCLASNLDGLFPMDCVLVEPTATNIYGANIDMIRAADGVIASLEPFRGPGMDSGTAFEVGFAKALGKPVFAYLDTNLPRAYSERCLKLDSGSKERKTSRGLVRDGNRAVFLRKVGAASGRELDDMHCSGKRIQNFRGGGQGSCGLL